MPVNRRVFVRASAVTVAAAVLSASRAHAAPNADKYPSNTALYADPALVDGRDYVRRLWRDDEPGRCAVLAPHGGGIEPGSSELALAIAGRHPAGEAPLPDTTLRDLWMFDAIRAKDNGELHVTSTHCDDPDALGLCADTPSAVAIHGCTAAQADLPDQAVLVGGRDAELRGALIDSLRANGFVAEDGAGHPTLGGLHPDNICNRTATGAGAQLEITTGLRKAMFETFTLADRKHTTTPVFWAFADAVRGVLP